MDNSQNQMLYRVTIDPATGQTLLAPAVSPTVLSIEQSAEGEKKSKLKRTKKSSSSLELKIKRAEGGYHRWNTEEEKKILEYMIHTIQGNRKIEKPTADAYYQKLVASVFSNVALDNEDINNDSIPTVNQVKNKVRNLKDSYLQAKRWSENTGEGVKDRDGEDTVEKIIEKLCPHFQELGEIYGTTVSVQPLYVHESSKVTFEGAVEINLDGGDRTIENILSDACGTSSDLKIEPVLESFENDALITKPSGKGNRNGKKPSSPKIDTLREKLTTPPRNGRYENQKNGLIALTEVQKLRVEVSEKKFAIEEKRIETLHKAEEAKVSVEKEKLSFEKEKHEDKKEIRLAEIASAEKLKSTRPSSTEH